MKLRLLICALALGVVASATAAQERYPALAQRVIVISLDGARPDALLQADTPHIQRLAERGAVTWDAQTVLPSVTLPAHTSMLTGLDVDDHGIDHNDNFILCPTLDIPTFVTRAADAGYRAAFVTGKEKFCMFDQTDAVDYTFVREGDRSVADRVIALLDEDYEVIFAHFPNPDYFGHRDGWMSEAYLRELRNTDRHVGRILARVGALDLEDETLIVLTADHGGHDTAHGSDRPEDMTIPFIMAGAGVAPGTRILSPVRVYDTAATVLWALGIPLPANLDGQPVSEAFAFFTF